MINPLFLIEKSVALLGGSSLALWDLQTKEKIIKFTGHAVSVQFIFGDFRIW
jgi:hypothetical protein